MFLHHDHIRCSGVDIELWMCYFYSIFLRLFSTLRSSNQIFTQCWGSTYEHLKIWIINEKFPSFGRELKGNDKPLHSPPSPNPSETHTLEAWKWNTPSYLITDASISKRGKSQKEEENSFFSFVKWKICPLGILIF